jgi:hypothetical protein
MNLALTAYPLAVDISGQFISDSPTLVTGIHSLKMIRASGKLNVVLDAVAASSQALCHLDVSSCSLSDMTSSSLCAVVSSPSIGCFEAAHIRDICTDDLVKVLGALNPGCRVLDLSGIFFSDTVSFDFSVLTGFDSLEKLSLRYWISVTDADLQQLPTTLLALDLSGVSLDSFTFLERLPQLGDLDLDGACLDDDAQQSLVAALSAKRDVRVRVDMQRLPQERALSPEYMAQIPVENNIFFY